MKLFDVFLKKTKKKPKRSKSKIKYLKNEKNERVHTFFKFSGVCTHLHLFFFGEYVEKKTWEHHRRSVLSIFQEIRPILNFSNIFDRFLSKKIILTLIQPKPTGAVVGVLPVG
jgi:hypothetical protein